MRAEPSRRAERRRGAVIGARRSRRATVVAVLAVAVLALAACDDESNLENDPPPQEHGETTVPKDDAPAPPAPRPTSAERLLQAWLAALEISDYRRAGSYFAPNALVIQNVRYRLRTRADAIGFNRGLPCRAHLLRVRGRGPTVLAVFLLTTGPGGPCTGTTYVRITIRDGRIAVFHQLPDDPARGIPRA